MKEEGKNVRIIKSSVASPIDRLTETATVATTTTMTPGPHLTPFSHGGSGAVSFAQSISQWSSTRCFTLDFNDNILPSNLVYDISCSFLFDGIHFPSFLLPLIIVDGVSIWCWILERLGLIKLFMGDRKRGGYGVTRLVFFIGVLLWVCSFFWLGCGGGFLLLGCSLGGMIGSVC